MGAFPTTPRSAFLDWCAEHAPIFSANAEDIGLSEVQANGFAAANTLAHTSVTAQGTAHTAAKAATATATTDVGLLRTAAGEVVRSIRAFAELAAKPNDVYALAQIPAPAPPTPFPPPGQPTNITVSLTPITGELTLKWKCTNPTGASGTSYIVRRLLPGEQWQFIGVTGRKEFVDDTLIAGPDSVQYTVQAQRSDSSGPISEGLTVNFGRLPDGAMFATAAGGGNAMYAPTASTVDGRPVQKMTPTGNGRPTSSRM